MECESEICTSGALGTKTVTAPEAQEGATTEPVSSRASRVLETCYGTDIHTSGMNRTMSDWNLSKFVKLPSNVLKYCQQQIPGVTSPMMYFGMTNSMFCWHAEDNDLNSISYLHSGSPKTWYGVPAENAGAFEAAFRAHTAGQMESHPDLLYAKAIMRPTPSELTKITGVKVTRALQEEGEFVITFPRAYHAGFSHGCNIGEAVNFATSGWIPYGRRAINRYRVLPVVKRSVIQHEQLLFELAGATQAGPIVLTQVRAELRHVRDEYSAKVKELEENGLTVTPVLPDSKFIDFLGVPCELCSHSCHVGAIAVPSADGSHQFMCLHHHEHLPADRKHEAVLLMWKTVDDLDEYISRIDDFFARGGANGPTDDRRCDVCMRGGNLLGPYSSEMFYAHEHCILWSKRIVVGSNGVLQPRSVGAAVRRGLQLRCGSCDGFGATLDCAGKAKGGCKGTYHFECANASKKIALDMVEYKCYCANHARGRPAVDFQRVKIAPGEYIDMSAVDESSSSDEDGVSPRAAAKKGKSGRKRAGLGTKKKGKHATMNGGGSNKKKITKKASSPKTAKPPAKPPLGNGVPNQKRAYSSESSTGLPGGGGGGVTDGGGGGSLSGGYLNAGAAPSDEQSPKRARGNRASFELGSVVWAKFDAFPFWPALMSDMTAADIELHVLVKFFESADYSWIPKDNVAAYKPGTAAPDGGRGAEINADSQYRQAIREAQAYLDSRSGFSGE
jgi:hypothetical protein